jgi:hypothetical protein
MHRRVRGWGQPSVFDLVTISYCTLRGGQMVTAGCGIAGCLGRCVLPYPDGGRPCIGPGQCRGHCVVDLPNLPLPFRRINLENTPLDGCIQASSGELSCAGVKLSGICEKAPAANCEFRWELNGTALKPIFVDCAM